MTRTMLGERVQLGVESQEGTAVNTTVSFASMGIDLDPNANLDLYRPMGSNWPSVSNLLSESATGTVEGRPDYNEIVYLLNGAVETGNITTPTNGINSRQHLFIPENSGEDTAKSFTIQVGPATGALSERVAGARFTGFSLHVGFDAIDLSGDLIARAVETGTNMNANASSLALAPIQPSHVCVYLDDTYANIGDTQLTELYDLTFGISNRWSLYHTVDCNVAPAPAGSVQAEPDSDVTLVMQADAAGSALFAQMRDGSTRYLRIACTGPLAETGNSNTAINYSLVIDAAVKVADSPSYDDSQGIRAVTWPLKVVRDASANLNAPFQITVVNLVAAIS